METLPTINLVEGQWYWVKDRASGVDGPWSVAKWEVGSFWITGWHEASPCVISGPIPHPDQPTPKEPEG